MKKYISIIVLLILIYSCSDNSVIEELETTINQQQNTIFELKDEITKKSKEIIQNEKKIVSLNENITTLENRDLLTQLGEEYDYNSYLVYDGSGILPSGFLKTSGYISNRSISKREEFEVDEEINYYEELIYEGYLFFLTDKGTPLTDYLTENLSNSYFIEDEEGYIGFPVSIDMVDGFGDLNVEMNVLLTIHRYPEYTPESTGVYFATVYLLRD